MDPADAVWFFLAVRWIPYVQRGEEPLSSGRRIGGYHEFVITCHLCAMEATINSYSEASTLTVWAIEHRRLHLGLELMPCLSSDCRAPKVPEGTSHFGPCTFDCRNPRCTLNSPHSEPCNLEPGR